MLRPVVGHRKPYGAKNNSRTEHVEGGLCQHADRPPISVSLLVRLTPLSRYSQLLGLLHHSLYNQNPATMRLSSCVILSLLVEIGLGQSLIEVSVRKWARANPANNSAVASATKSTGHTQGSGTRSTTLSGASSSPTGPSVTVDLGGAKLGDHSKFTDKYGGKAM